MGRYYHGDIEGKFWFGVQSSTDAEFFGVEGNANFLHYYFDEDNKKDIVKGKLECERKLGKYKKLLDDNMIVTRDENDIKSGQYTLAKIQNNFGGLMAYIKDKYPKSFILNDMPFEKALKTFRSFEREI